MKAILTGRRLHVMSSILPLKSLLSCVWWLPPGVDAISRLPVQVKLRHRHVGRR
jgi:hypothetical protein